MHYLLPSFLPYVGCTLHSCWEVPPCPKGAPSGDLVTGGRCSTLNSLSCRWIQLEMPTELMLTGMLTSFSVKNNSSEQFWDTQTTPSCTNSKSHRSHLFLFQMLACLNNWIYWPFFCLHAMTFATMRLEHILLYALQMAKHNVNAIDIVLVICAVLCKVCRASDESDDKIKRKLNQKEKPRENMIHSFS